MSSPAVDGSDRSAGPGVAAPDVGGPDVTVITAVYNTMPYLTACLTSLVEQSIGLDRLEIVAVDDGSTDGSEAELDAFAARYPGTVRVIHQANSGGPAGPSNRALDVATGRYVFFIGSDDYLGTEALARLVAAADTYGSDVVAGRMVGVNGRYAHQAIFADTQPDIDLFASALPYHLSNTKLFRRELLERHKLRYPEDMPVGSDQPFTLEACLRAKRISVLADYDYYYAVRRRNARNITYSSDHEQRLRYTETVMAFAAGLIEPGTQRDAVLLRHFDWELAKLVADDFRNLDPAAAERVRSGIAALADAYLTDAIRDRLAPESRVRLSVAQYGDLAALTAVIHRDAEVGVPPTVVEDGRRYAAYPGFREPGSAIPDSAYDVTTVTGAWAGKLDAIAISGGLIRSTVTITARSPLTDLASHGTVALRAGIVAATAVTIRSGRHGTLVRARFDVAALADRAPRRGRRLWTLGGPLGAAEDVPLRGPGFSGLGPVTCRCGRDLFVVATAVNDKGQLAVTITPVTARRAVTGPIRRLIRKALARPHRSEKPRSEKPRSAKP